MCQVPSRSCATSSHTGDVQPKLAVGLNVWGLEEKWTVLIFDNLALTRLSPFSLLLFGYLFRPLLVCKHKLHPSFHPWCYETGQVLPAFAVLCRRSAHASSDVNDFSSQVPASLSLS